MQWLIDIILEWIIAKGYATEAWVLAKVYATQAWVQGHNYATQMWVISQHYLDSSFIRRAPPGDWDWEIPVLVADGLWHFLECGTIVPAGAKAILFNQYADCPTVERSFRLRYPNVPYWAAIPGLITQVANVAISGCTIVTCDPNRRIHYRFTNVAWNAGRLYILGWWV